jgi:hypothetical protein
MISPTNFGQIDLKAFNFIEVEAHQPAGVPQCTREQCVWCLDPGGLDGALSQPVSCRFFARSRNLP